MAGTGGGCEAAVTAGTRCGLATLRECEELVYSKRLPLKLKGTVFKSYVMSAILHESEAWCLKKMRLEFYEDL